MRNLFVAVLVSVASVALATTVRAQEPPPPIGPFVLDVHGNVPRMGTESQLAPSRGLVEDQLPGTGLGVDAAVHLYPIRWRAVTFGVGGRLLAARARSGAATSIDGLALSGVTEHFVAGGPELSFNFGTGNGWSYISGGVGLATWSVVADGQSPIEADVERLRMLHYGAGARWFMKRHLAFSVDVRFFQNDPGAAHGDLPGTPRSSTMVMGAGISVK